MKLQRSQRRSLILLLVGSGLIATSSAIAAMNASLPPEQFAGNIAYLSGGVGKDEADAMKQAAARYPLELTFVTRETDGHNAYLAGDKVTVRDHAGKIVLDTQSGGPFLLAKLPPGKYTVEAIDNGKTQERSVVLKPDQHARLIFEW